MTDRHAVIWTQVGGSPIKMANLVMTSRECRITYTKDFVNSGLPGLSLMVDPSIIKEDTLVWTSTESRPLHPRLMAMVPPNHAGNIQRKIYADILSRRTSPPAPGMETEWEMLMLSGHNGIGHLDVFRDDVEAFSWYSQRKERTVAVAQSNRSKIWNILRDEVRQHIGEHGNISDLVDILGPTATAGGMITKFLFSIPDGETWDGDFLPSGLRSENISFIDAVVKVESPLYDGVLDLESLCLDVHREANFAVPRSWRKDIDGLRLLAVERFDRTKDGIPVPLESLMMAFAAGSKRIQDSSDVMWPEVGKMITKIGQLCNLNIREAQETLFRRLAFALMTGNGDMHLDNLGFLGGKEAVSLAPVYDPAPMRAWRQHNMLMSVPIDFEKGKPIYAQIADTATAFGLSVTQGTEILVEAARSTCDFGERVMALTNVPLERRQSLVNIVSNERHLLQAAFSVDLTQCLRKGIGTTDSRESQSLAEQWNAIAPSGTHSGSIKAMSDSEVIQYIGQDRNVVWARSALSGAQLQVGKSVRIDKDGKVTETKSRKMGVAQ